VGIKVSEAVCVCACARAFQQAGSEVRHDARAAQTLMKCEAKRMN
jgi:hypothetical protein